MIEVKEVNNLEETEEVIKVLFYGKIEKEMFQNIRLLFFFHSIYFSMISYTHRHLNSSNPIIHNS
jgi:hypothetical protein